MTRRDYSIRVGERLSHLIDTVRPTPKRRYRYREIAEGIADHPGAMSHSLIHRIAAGTLATPPAVDQLEALAGFFGVDISYFTDPRVAARVDDEIRAVTEFRDSPEYRVAQRLLQLNEDGRGVVETFITGVEANPAWMAQVSAYEAQDRRDRRRRRDD